MSNSRDSLFEDYDRRLAAYAESARTWKAERDAAVEALEALQRRIERLARNDDGDKLSWVARQDVWALLKPPEPETAVELVEALAAQVAPNHDSATARLLAKLRDAVLTPEQKSGKSSA